MLDISRPGPRSFDRSKPVQLELKGSIAGGVEADVAVVLQKEKTLVLGFGAGELRVVDATVVLAVV